MFMDKAVRHTSVGNPWFWVVCVGLVLITAGFILSMSGRPAMCTCGNIRLWVSDIHSTEDSQQVFDPNTFFHIIPGMAIYAVFWLARKKWSLPLGLGFVLAACLCAAWEIMENMPWMVEHYRQVTISVYYSGDTIINSLADILVGLLGFFLASRLQTWQALALAFSIELGLLFLIRDNLTLNFVMLVHPISAVKAWQMAG